MNYSPLVFCYLDNSINNLDYHDSSKSSMNIKSSR